MAASRTFLLPALLRKNAWPPGATTSRICGRPIGLSPDACGASPRPRSSSQERCFADVAILSVRRDAGRTIVQSNDVRPPGVNTRRHNI